MGELKTRQTTGNDRALIESLLSGARRKHLHLDWLEAAALTDRKPFLIASRDEQTAACLGCPPDLPRVAWVRAFAVASDCSIQTAWTELWERAAHELEMLGVKVVAAMAMDAWFGDLLNEAGFTQSNSVLFFEYDLNHRFGGPTDNLQLRMITAADFEGLLGLDELAFEPFWRLGADSLRAAVGQAASASVAEQNGSLIGYQITTGSPFGAHLARLAVHPDWQRRGLGSALVAESIRTAQQLGVGRLSVNTQADNIASQNLYLKMGFQETGQRFPVHFLTL